MTVLPVDDETCQECADFLSLVERHADAAKQGQAKPHEYGEPAKTAADRLGFAPFEYEERN